MIIGLEDRATARALAGIKAGKGDSRAQRDVASFAADAEKGLQKLVAGTEVGSAVHDDLVGAENNDDFVTTVMLSRGTGELKVALDSLRAARQLKENALAKLTVGEQPATASVAVPFAQPTATPAGETFVMTLTVAAPKVESVVADIQPSAAVRQVKGLIEVFSQNTTPGKTDLTLQGVLVEPAGTSPLPNVLIIDMKAFTSSLTTAPLVTGPLQVVKFASAVHQTYAQWCRNLKLPSGNLNFAGYLTGTGHTLKLGTASVPDCKVLVPEWMKPGSWSSTIPRPKLITTPKAATSRGSVALYGSNGGYTATIKNPSGGFTMTLPGSYKFSAAGTELSWSCAYAASNIINCRDDPTSSGWKAVSAIHVFFGTTPPLGADASGKIKITIGSSSFTLNGP